MKTEEISDTVRVLFVREHIELSKAIGKGIQRLSEYCYECEYSSSVNEGREMLGDQHIVVTGIGSKSSDDYLSFLRELKERGYNVIVASGYAEDKALESIINGADAYICVPSTPKEVVHVFDRFAEEIFQSKKNII